MVPAFALLTLLSAPTAQAGALSVSAGTEVPLAVGAAVGYRPIAPLEVRVFAGVMPGAYVDLVNAVVVGLGGYDDNTAELVASALKSAFVLHLTAEWTPFVERGWTVGAGYAFAGLGGGAAASDIVAVAVGQSVGVSVGPNIDITSAIHMLTVSTGWQWRVEGQWLLRAQLGFAATVAAHTTAQADPDGPLGRALADAGAAYLDDVYTSYVFTPYAEVSVGYVFDL